MTFVKTRLLIEKMAAGETALIRLTGEEPLGNVPASVTELGHTVMSMVREDGETETDPAAIHLLTIRKIPLHTKN